MSGYQWEELPDGTGFKREYKAFPPPDISAEELEELEERIRESLKSSVDRLLKEQAGIGRIRTLPLPPKTFSVRRVSYYPGVPVVIDGETAVYPLPD